MSFLLSFRRSGSGAPTYLALAHAFAGRFAAAEGKDVPGCTLAAANLLASHPWPGNVRQLENTIFSAVVLSPDPAPATPSLHPEPADSGIPFAGAEVELKDDKGDLRPLRDIEEQVIRLALKSYQGRMSEVARKLGIGRSTLYRKVREFGLRDNVPRAERRAAPLRRRHGGLAPARECPISGMRADHP